MEKIPKFKTAKEEAEFWETHSPLDFPSEFKDVKEPIVDRRGRKKGIYIRIDPEAIELARHIGAELGVGYQTLFRMWIMEGLSRQTRREPDISTGRLIVLQETLRRLPPESQEMALDVCRQVMEQVEALGPAWAAWRSRSTCTGAPQ
jgi:hypothetical protein